MSNSKGRGGELEVRDLLLAWWQQVEPGVKMVRTPASGGWHAATEFAASGDLMVNPGSKFPWSVEVKRREGWSPARFVAGFKSPVWGWWLQACRDGARLGKPPMLWVRRSRAEWIVLVPLGQAVQAGVDPRWVWLDPVLQRYAVPVVPGGMLGPEFLSTHPAVWSCYGA